MNLPAGAQTWLACGYDNAWTLQEYLTAALIDAANIGNWQRSGDAKAQPPTPVRRPADIRKDASEPSPEARRLSRAQAFRERAKRQQSTEPEEA